MLAFLISLLTVVLTIAASLAPNFSGEKIISRIEEKTASVSEPKGNTIPDEDRTAVYHPNEVENPAIELPNTQLSAAFNTKGEVVIKKVASVATEKSPALIQAESSSLPQEQESTQNQSNQTPVIQGPFVGGGTVGQFNGDLRDLPKAKPWQPGDPIGEIHQACDTPRYCIMQ